MIIGITGPAGAGKDTAADYLVARYDFVKVSWAGPLKAMLAAGGFPEPANREDKEIQIPGFAFSWRQAAQHLGTEWGRALDPDIWTKIVGEQIRNSPNVNWVISDVRFENEAKLIRELGGELWHLTGRAADLGAAAGHSSETGVVPVDGDRLIRNDGNERTALYKMIDLIIREVSA